MGERWRAMFGIDADTITMLSGVALYASIFLLPFVQEDVAVIAAATASIAGAGSSAILFIAILLGLTASDVWKYWVGWFARHHSWAHRFARNPAFPSPANWLNMNSIKR